MYEEYQNRQSSHHQFSSTERIQIKYFKIQGGKEKTPQK